MSKLNFYQMTPVDLGQTQTKEAIPFLILYLENGNDNEKRLAASAISKLMQQQIPCEECVPFLIKNLKNKKPQVRQYTLKTLQLFDIPEQFKSFLMDCFNEEDKDYNLKLFHEILHKMPDFSEIDFATQHLMSRIKQDLDRTQAKEELEDKGYVYFIQEDFSNRIKIGKTKRLDDRLTNFGVKLPFNVKVIHTIKTRNCSYTEKLFHLFFDAKKVNGEWFDLDENEINWIKSGYYTKKINHSITGPTKTTTPVETPALIKKITPRQADYLASLLQEHELDIKKPLLHLTINEASELINCIIYDSFSHTLLTRKIN